jgi:hypothetical protein
LENNMSVLFSTNQHACLYWDCKQPSSLPARVLFGQQFKTVANDFSPIWIFLFLQLVCFYYVLTTFTTVGYGAIFHFFV